MLKEFYNTEEHLLKKRTHIVITNVCNLSCGGCHEFCGHFEKDKLWFISPEDFEKYVKLIKSYEINKGCNIQKPTEQSKTISEIMKRKASGKYPKKILSMFDYSYVSDFREYAKVSVFGGEPTLHPQWNALLKIMYSHSDITFKVSTNGLKNHCCGAKNKNVIYIVDRKLDLNGKMRTDYEFAPTMIAPIDIIPKHKNNKKWFWYKAQRDCDVWKGCATSIYKDKAYFCEVAAAMDYLMNDGANGWKIDNKYPFYKTKKEIEEQASKFCYRCAWCIKNDEDFKENETYKQMIHEPTITSPTNYNCINKKKNLVQLSLPDEDERLKNPEESPKKNLSLPVLQNNNNSIDP